MKPEDFKAALEIWLDQVWTGNKETVSTHIPLERYEQIDDAIVFALRLAEKVCGEPSVAAIDAAKAEFKKLEKACNEVGERLSWEGGAMVVHQTMISQAVKEFEG